MSIAQFSTDELKKMSLIEVVHLLLEEKKQPIPFQEIITELKKRLSISEQEMEGRLAQFYTDLNIDGRFICMGENRWALKSWYPFDQLEDETQPVVKQKKKKKTKKKTTKKEKVIEEKEEELVLDDLEDLDEDYDDDDDLLDDDLDEEDLSDDDDDLLDDEEEDEDE
ncbi:DNA-directed RNA polymerase subunit delta [Bacillus carboniphilus]|uniref:Probable DNA-directed RNA polymerase subunit delta n=1 Tax=Bacillus carboniphilus TaxID=86663 RepID=A0ABY9JT64_9BACI|nr:DNA-directed RNA polymerase subunit delta [Bacillus carboniphilus]WLR41698.1 DNA-directed RNA polymerase subunit delta [Bacillus carboniphilus]